MRRGGEEERRPLRDEERRRGGDRPSLATHARKRRATSPSPTVSMLSGLATHATRRRLKGDQERGGEEAAER
jgi:hypothetical protein